MPANEQDHRVGEPFGELHVAAVEAGESGGAEDEAGVSSQQADGEVPGAGGVGLVGDLGDAAQPVGAQWCLGVDVGAMQLGVTLQQTPHDRLDRRRWQTGDGMAVPDRGEGLAQVAVAERFPRPLAGGSLGAPGRREVGDEVADHLRSHGQLGGEPVAVAERPERAPVLGVGGLGVRRPAVRRQPGADLHELEQLGLGAGDGGEPGDQLVGDGPVPSDRTGLVEQIDRGCP